MIIAGDMGPLYIGDITSLLGKMSHDHPTQLYSVVSISHNSSFPFCWHDTLESHATLTVPVIVTLVSPVTCFVLVFRFLRVYSCSSLSRANLLDLSFG